MCNAYNHSADCECGFGPPYPNVGVAIRKLYRIRDRRSSRIADLDLSFPLPKTNFFHLIDKTGRERLLTSTVEVLQRLADNRFGKGNIKVIPDHVKKGSINVSVVLVAAYVFFKNYEVLRKNIVRFAKDIKHASSTLYQVVRRRYLSEERRSLKKAKKERKQREAIRGKSNGKEGHS